MASNIILRNIELADKAEIKLVKSSTQVEAEIWKLIQDLLREFDIKDGKFLSGENSNKLLLKLNKELKKLIGETKLYDNVADFLDNFDEIAQNVQAAHSELNDLKISNNLVNSQKQWAVENTIEFLKQSQISNKFIEPVRRALYSKINFGASITDTEKQIRQMIVGDESHKGILTRWVGQVARDAVNQYEGVINQKIKVEYELTATRYVGPIIEDSRDQCVRWVGMKLIPDDILQSEIEWAFANGSGMIPETDPSNFCVNRGGYNCIHTAFPVKNKTK